MSSPATDALQTALAQVIDPELRRNVVELGMVDAVDVDGQHVHVTIRLTVPGCPLKSNIEAQVQMHVGAVPGVDGVSVGFTHMDEQQRAALRSQLRGGRSESERTIAVEERTRVIAIASGKGGVGKSSLTVNLALALCYLADGRLDAVASLRPHGARAIDIAAGQLLVREAGGAVALPDTPEPFGAAPLDLEGRSRVVAARDDRSLARVAALLGIGPGAGPASHPG